MSGEKKSDLESSILARAEACEARAAGRNRQGLEEMARRDAFAVLPAPAEGVRDVSPVLVAWLEENAAPGLLGAMKAGIDGRNAFGLTKYPHLLRTGDGRPTGTEVWHEILDGLQYAMKARMEGESIDTPPIREAHRLLGELLGPRPAEATANGRCRECYGLGWVRGMSCNRCDGTGDEPPPEGV